MPGATSTLSVTWFVFGILLVGIFAWLRPRMLKDFDDRPLARNVTAQVFFTVIYLLLYVVLVAAFQGGGKLVTSLSQDVTLIGALFKFVKADSGSPGIAAPLLALTVIGWFQSLKVLRQIEQTCLVFTYSARYMHADVQELTEHLQRCTFDPADAERREMRKVLERLHVFLTDNDTRAIDLQAVDDWRKVDTLLRYLDAWADEGKIVLNPVELTVFAAAKTAHQRKTKLAADLIRLLDHLASGRAGPERSSQLSAILAEARAGGSQGLEKVAAQLESVVETVLESATGSAIRTDRGAGSAVDAAVAHPVRLSNQQMKIYIEQIQGYFQEEYRILLEEVAELTAKSVIHSGDKATERLRTVKRAGFAGLGRILPISLNRVLWSFFAVLALSALIYAIRMKLAPFNPNLPRGTQHFTMLIATISVTMAFAAIIGAVIGSTRTFAQSPRLPLLPLFGAGLLAVTIFFVAHHTRLALLPDEARAQAASSAAPTPTTTTTAASQPRAGAVAEEPRSTPAQTDGPPTGPKPTQPLRRQWTLSQMAPWAVLPFTVTLAICLLARISAWPLLGTAKAPAAAIVPAGQPAAGAPQRARRGWIGTAERTLDGLALGLVMVAAVALLLRGFYPLMHVLMPHSGFELPRQMLDTMKIHWLPLPLTLTQFAIGFVIGALILRDVRRAGHSRVISEPLPKQAKIRLPRGAGRLPLPLGVPVPGE